MTPQQARVLAQALSFAALRAEKTGAAEIDMTVALQDIDDAARAELEAAIRRAAGA